MNISRMISNWEAITTSKKVEESPLPSLPKLTKTRRCSTYERSSSERSMSMENLSSISMIDINASANGHISNEFSSSYEHINISADQLQEKFAKNEENFTKILEEINQDKNYKEIMDNINSALTDIKCFVYDEEISPAINAENSLDHHVSEKSMTYEVNQHESISDHMNTLVQPEIEKYVPLRKISIHERRTHSSVHLLNLPIENCEPVPHLEIQFIEGGTSSSPLTPKSPGVTFIKKIFKKQDSSDNLSSSSDSPKKSPLSVLHVESPSSPTQIKNSRQSLQLTPDSSSPKNPNSPRSSLKFSFHLSKSPRGSRDTSPMSGSPHTGSPNIPSPLTKSSSFSSSPSSKTSIPSGSNSQIDNVPKSILKDFSKNSKQEKEIAQVEKKHLRHTKSSPVTKMTLMKSTSPNKLSMKFAKKDKKSPDFQNSNFFIPSNYDNHVDGISYERKCSIVPTYMECDLVAQISNSSGFKYYNPKDCSTSPSMLRKGVSCTEFLKSMRLKNNQSEDMFAPISSNLNE